jgi:hypothetical protein
MLRDTPARCGRGIGGSRRPSILELLACIPSGTRIAVVVGLLACFGLDGLWASTRAVPHRLTVHPNGATVAANQTQQFEVTDAEGRSVAVHWNISGLGCSGLACGSIDEQGVYRTPSSLPQPRVVTLEGVLVSDPSYSVLTQVRLEDAVTVTVSPASAHVATGRTQQFTVLMVGRQNVASRAELPPLPNAVAAAPVVARPNLASSAELPPLPNAVAAALMVGRQNVASRAELPPLPNGVAAAPVVGRQNVARSVELPPLPYAVAALSPTSAQIPTPKTQQFAAPVVGRQNIASSAGLLPVPDEVAAAPAGTVVSAQHPPVVTYRDGQLTINAQNSTLAEVLKLVAEKTGAVIEVPPGSGLDRIVEHTGPGQADDVLARLLNGSPFDFIIVGSPQRPHELTQVLLSLRQADTPASLPPQLAKTVASPFLYTPPEPAPFAPAVATDLDNFQPPKEPLSPEVIGQMMKQLRQHLPPSQ